MTKAITYIFWCLLSGGFVGYVGEATSMSPQAFAVSLTVIAIMNGLLGVAITRIVERGKP